MQTKNSTRCVRDLDVRAVLTVKRLKLEPTDKLVMMILATESDRHRGHTCYPGQELLAELTGLGLRTVRDSTKRLAKMGFITMTARRTRHGNKSYEYRLQPAAIAGSTDEPAGKSQHSQPANDDKKTGDLPAAVADEGKAVLQEKENQQIEVEGKKPASTSSTLPDTTDTLLPEEKDTPHCAAPPNDEPRDIAAARSMLHAYVGAREISDAELMQANQLVRNYASAVTKGAPRARTAFWFELRRTFYPKLPASSTARTIPAGQLRQFHATIDELGKRAPLVVAFAMAHWDTIRAEIPKATKYPNIPDLAEHLAVFVRAWRESLLPLSQDDDVLEFLLRIGVDA